MEFFVPMTKYPIHLVALFGSWKKTDWHLNILSSKLPFTILSWGIVVVVVVS